MKKKIDKESKLGDEIIRSLTESFFASGVFTENDIKDKKSHILALKNLISNNELENLSVTIDHTNALTSEARKHKKRGDINYSKIFYATFFEHQINELIHLYCLRNEIENKTRTSIIQSINIWGKFTWLLELMKYPKFNTNHLKTIKNIADSRNAFVHYKWNQDPDFNTKIDSKKEKDNIDNEFEKIEKAVKYFKNYSSRIKYKGKKEHIKKIMK
jgi:hypothetical protein